MCFGYFISDTTEDDVIKPDIRTIHGRRWTRVAKLKTGDMSQCKDPAFRNALDELSRLHEQGELYYPIE